MSLLPIVCPTCQAYNVSIGKCASCGNPITEETQPDVPAPVSSAAPISAKVSLPHVDIPMQLDTGYYFMAVEHGEKKLPSMKEILADRGIIIEPSAQCLQDFHRARFTAYSIVVKESMVFDALRKANARVAELEAQVAALEAHVACKEANLQHSEASNLSLLDECNSLKDAVNGLVKRNTDLERRVQEPVSYEVGESALLSAPAMNFHNCTVQIFTSPAVASPLE